MKDTPAPRLSGFCRPRSVQSIDDCVLFPSPRLKNMQGRATIVLIGSSVAALCALAVACAGAATPATDDTIKDQLAIAYGTGLAGSAGSSAGGSASTSAVLAPDAPVTGPTGAGGGAMAGGAGSTGMAGSTAMMGPCDGFAILSAHCSGDSCHGAATATAGGLSNFASSLDAAKSFVGKQSAQCGAKDNAALLDPTNPGASLIVAKVSGTSSCGAQMPLNSPTLTVNDLNCLKDWISSL